MPMRFDPAHSGRLKPVLGPTGLVLGPTAVSFSASAMPGLVVGALTGRTPGSSYAIAPVDTKVVLNTDNNLAVGTTPSVAGANQTYVVTETAPNGAQRVLEVAVTVTPAVAPPAAGLVGWYKAEVGVSKGATKTVQIGTATYDTINDGFAIMGWADQSGSGNNITGSDDANAPVIVTVNGNPRVRFQNVAKKLTLPAGMAFDNSNLAVFAIIRSAPYFDGVTPTYDGGLALSALFTAGTSQGVAGLTIAGGGSNNGAPGQGRIALRDSGLATSSLFSGQGEELVGMWCRQPAAPTKVKLIQGVETALAAGGAVTTTTGGYVGSYTGSANGFIGDLLELLIYNVSTVDEAAIRAYAQARMKAGPALSQPVLPLFIDGDSQAIGQYGGYNANSAGSVNQNDTADNMAVKLAHLIAAGGGQTKLMNFGIGSQTIAAQRTRASTANYGADAYVIGSPARFPVGTPGYQAPVLIIDMGTNSIASTIGNQDGPTTVADLDGYLADRIAAGWNPARIYVVPIRPRSANGQGPAYDAARAFYNGLTGAPARCAARGARWLGQILAHPAWSGLASTDQTYYQHDSLHQNQRTMAELASMIYAQLFVDGVVPA